MTSQVVQRAGPLSAPICALGVKGLGYTVERETRSSHDESFCIEYISSLSSVKVVIYKIWVFVSRI